MADGFDFLGDEPTSEEQQQALVAALRRQQGLGVLGQLSGDSVLSGVGTGMIQSGQHQAQMFQQARDRALQRQMMVQKEAALEDYRNQKLAQPPKGAASAGLDPESVIHLRPDFVEALGGEDAVRGLSSAQLLAGLKAFEAKQQDDYRKKALEGRSGAQSARTDVMAQRLGIMKTKLGLDIGGRQVPGMEMEDGYVMQPAEAEAAKKLRGNVQRSLKALGALREDFVKYGPQRLQSLGGSIPTPALSRMEGNRARLLEAAMQLQGMNPTVGHQELLEQQLRDPGSFKNINRESYLAQLDELEKSIRETETAFAAGHGVKRVAPLKPSEAAGQAPAAPAKTAVHTSEEIAAAKKWLADPKHATHPKRAQVQALVEAAGG